MTEQQFRIAEIEVSKSPTDEKILGIFRFEGGNQTKKGTSLVIIAEVASTLYVYERLLDIISATAEQAKHMVAGVEQDPVARFEKLIQRLNDSVATFLEGEPTPLAWNRVNLFVLELSQDHVCLTGTGRLMNVFLQKQPDGSFRTFDLFGSLEQPADVDPKKPFASIICGDMKPGDVLIAGTTNLERLRNELRIKERLTTLPPVSAALEIKQDLERRGIPDDFLGVVIASVSLEMPSSIAAKVAAMEKDKSTASINKLRETEKDADNHLSPTIAPSKPGATQMTIAKRAMGGVLGLIHMARAKIMNGDRTKDIAAMASLRGMNAGHGSRFTKKHKTIAIAAGVIVLVGIIGISVWKRSQRLAVEAAAWQSTFDDASDNRNRAESDLVYANDARARKEIETAEQLLASLNLSDAKNKEKVEALRGQLDQLKERLRKVTVVEPVELAALTGVPDGSLAAPVLAKGNAYVVDNSAHKILKIDVADKTKKEISLPAGTEPIVAGSLGTQSVVFTTAKGKFYSINIQTDEVSQIGSQPKASSTTDIVLYGGRAYSLDGPNGQIWRGQSGTNGFGAETAYIKASNIPLQNSVALAIDSNVYILKADGTLARFLSGGQEGFSLTQVDPPLRAASGIWTTADAQRIAITDPAGKRVLVFNKDGTLKAQLTSPSFSSPRDVDGDDANKRLIVIDGTRLLLIPLP
ncbi:MAG: hypothetical protein WC787_03225 [Patescibacteria group bacterium]